MLPLHLLVGFTTGVTVHDRRSLTRALSIGVATSLVFGVVLALDAGVDLSPVGAVAFGFVLGVANHLVGLVLGAGVRGGAELAARRVRAVS